MTTVPETTQAGIAETDQNSNNSAEARELRPYPGQEHQPFYWAGGRSAALLVHGFPGTPAEMREVGQLLHNAGWTAHGLLLPGFGPDIANLSDYGHTDWLDAILEEVASLRQTHDRVVLVGHSVGAALSLTAASRTDVDGLLLFAPFLRMDNRLIDTFFPLIRLLRREMRPFEEADFGDPEVREAIGRFLPDADLDDPDVRDQLRELSLPLSTLSEVRKAGRLAYRHARAVRRPVLILQGSDDEVARPALSRKLARRLPELGGYVEVAGGHDITHNGLPSGKAIPRLIVRFLESVCSPQPACG